MPVDTTANLLIVDDTLANLRLLVNLLQEHGYKVRPATSGAQALTAAQAWTPDLVLLDINMPEMNGYEVCRQLKANPRTCDVPVIFLSAASEVMDKVQAFAVGGIDYITKPFQLEEVLVRIQTHLKIRELQSQLSSQNKTLSQTLKELQKTQQYLIESEKMAVLGQLVASVAHEMNTPMGAIRSSAGTINQFLQQSLRDLPPLLQSLKDDPQMAFTQVIATSLKNTFHLQQLSTREKRQIRRSLLEQLLPYDQCETIADLLVDIGIFDLDTAVIILLALPNHLDILHMIYGLTGLQRSTQTVLDAVEQASSVVQALRQYAYHSDLSEPVEVRMVEAIETCLTLYHNQMKHGVEVVRNYAAIPIIHGYPDELTQVWSNLIGNALQAMHYQGTLTISLREIETGIEVTIHDTGDGIAPELLPRIFEPFFTTKSNGDGTGLGLSIVKKFIDKHGGQIHVSSQPGSTTFTVVLPIYAPIQNGSAVP
ncbi:MAG: response regulator [Synechococcales bacterium]|nr:response regulator [Synechococcales bacterium]